MNYPSRRKKRGLYPAKTERPKDAQPYAPPPVKKFDVPHKPTSKPFRMGDLPHYQPLEEYVKEHPPTWR